MAERDIAAEPYLAALRFVGQMGGLQIDQLGRLARPPYPFSVDQVAAGWRKRGYIATGHLSAGPEWIWLTRLGLQVCSLGYAARKPTVPAHTRAVSETRLAFEQSRLFREGSASWHCERDIRSSLGTGRGDHVPDAVVTWPDGTAVAWAGENWAIEVEIARKGTARTTGIMRELLFRTGEYGCPAAEVRERGKRPLHTRVLYLCSSRAESVVLRARAGLSTLAGRVEVCALPAHASIASIEETARA